MIHEESLPCDVSLDELDMDWLRRQYSTLFDRAAQAIFRLGYDLDDVIVERFIRCGVSVGEALAIALPSLQDAALIEKAVRTQFSAGETAEKLASPRSPEPRASARATTQDSMGNNDRMPDTGTAQARIAKLSVAVTLERW